MEWRRWSGGGADEVESPVESFNFEISMEALSHTRLEEKFQN